MESENQDHETCGEIGTFVGLGPMEGRTRILLIAPGPVTRNTFGDTASTPIEHPRSALRTDRGGRRAHP